MLKAPSKTFIDIQKMTSSSSASAKELGELVAQDPLLARTILRVANNRQRGLGREVLNPDRASLLLGATTIRHISLIHELVHATSDIQLKTKERLSLWEDCLRRACAAHLLAERYGAIHPDMAFAVGLSLEYGRIGLIASDQQISQSYGQVRGLLGEDRIEAEINNFGTTSHEAFVELTESWPIPDVLRDALAKHQECPENIREEANQPLTTFIARWADVAAEIFTAKQAKDAYERASGILIDEAGMTKAEVDAFIDQVALQAITYANVLSLPLDPQPSLEKLLKENEARQEPENMSKEELLGYVDNLLVHQEELEEELQELRSHVLSMTQFDQLTGLPSRGHFMINLRQEVARARRYDRPLSLVVVDIDEFTEFNAKNGQDIGDESLRTTSRILERVVRDSDFLARTGGDEFAIVLPETDGPGGRVFAERVRAAIEALKVDTESKRLRISACVCGLSLVNITADSDHEILYAAALRAVKKLRERGPNRVTWVDTHSG